MKPSISLFLYLTATVAIPSTLAAPPEAHELTPEYSFEQYLTDFGKEKDYPNENSKLYKSKKQVFESNLEHILKHNSNVQYDIKTGERRMDADLDAASYHMGVNKFMEFTEDEIKSSFHTGRHDKRSTLRKRQVLEKGAIGNYKKFTDHNKNRKLFPFGISPLSSLPPSIDYSVNKTITTPVKEQGPCNSAWALSSIAGLETTIALQSNKPVEVLSSQELLSCVNNPQHCGGTGGCDGATPGLAYHYVSVNGIMKEDSFPFEENACHSPKNVFAKKIKGYGELPSNNYLALMNAVAKHGPVVVSVDASQWFNYAGGIFDVCSTNDINHFVVVVGYGTEEQSGQDYWLIRNSWGENWGNRGYMRLVRSDTDNLRCYSADKTTCALNSDGTKKAFEESLSSTCGCNGMLNSPTIPVP